MYLILVFALALLGCGRSANVNKHMRLLDLDNHIENHAPPTKQTGARRFLTITQRPLATYALSSGDVLELTCDAVGAPAPSIHWFRNDAPVYEPRIVVTYEMYVDTIGNNIVLPCRVKGHPKPHVSWIDNKGNVVKKDERMKVLRSGELVISSLRWSDMGEFSCQATNVFGSQLAKTFVYPAKAG
ncbi:hypothetical protein B5X24_HaOG205097 [Helicoverpa armigera]|uniref:Ig-like domain-containing protein n=1 Tax=Helicoverpa armigera TaxID=29058 RepID=A0A2W1BU10_HELAM|nr:hypothetical protein B5X24_HaOG205097 [Helicoverpa armigera]